jgi:lipopolysaccharide/colanic/teichoic acid biosynthesis glycosyltransferase
MTDADVRAWRRAARGARWAEAADGQAPVRRRLFDLRRPHCAAAAGAVLLLVALAIKLDSPGPVFFRQERVGRAGVPFRIHKFRTMRWTPAAGPLTVGRTRASPASALAAQEQARRTAAADRRAARHMSLVGPRPEVPRYVAHYPPELRERVLSVRPGITDPASLALHRRGRTARQAPTPSASTSRSSCRPSCNTRLHYADRPTFGSTTCA